MSEEDLYHSSDSTMDEESGQESFLLVSETESMCSPGLSPSAKVAERSSEDPASREDEEFARTSPTQVLTSDDECIYSSPPDADDDEENADQKPPPRSCWEEEEDTAPTSPTLTQQQPADSTFATSSTSLLKDIDSPSQHSGVEDIESFPRPVSLEDSGTSCELQTGNGDSNEFPRPNSWVNISTPPSTTSQWQSVTGEIQSLPRSTLGMDDSFLQTGRNNEAASSIALGQVSSTIPDASFISSPVELRSSFSSSPLASSPPAALGRTPIPKPRSRTSLSRRQLQQSPNAGSKISVLEVKVRELTQELADERRLRNEWQNSYDDVQSEAKKAERKCSKLEADLRRLTLEKKECEEQISALQKQQQQQQFPVSSSYALPEPVSAEGEDVEILKRELEEKNAKICELEKANAGLVATQKQAVSPVTLSGRQALSPMTPSGRRQLARPDHITAQKLNDSMEENAQLKKQIKEMGDCKQRLETMEVMKAALEREKEDLEQQLSAEQMARRQLQDEQLCAIELEKRQLESDLESLRVAHENAIFQLKAGFDQQLAEKEELCGRLNGEIERLNRELATRQDSSHAELMKKEEEMEELKRHHQSLIGQHTEHCSRLQHDNDKLQRECTGIKKEKNQLSGVVKDYEEETDTIMKEFEGTAAELKEALNERDEAVQQRGRAMTELTYRITKIKDLETALQFTVSQQQAAIEAEKQLHIDEVELLQHQLQTEKENLGLLDIQLETFREDFAVERQAREAMVATRDKEKEKLQKQALEIRELRLKLNEQSQRTLEEGFDDDFIESTPMDFNSSGGAGGFHTSSSGDLLRARDPNPAPIRRQPPNYR